MTARPRDVAADLPPAQRAAEPVSRSPIDRRLLRLVPEVRGFMAVCVAVAAATAVLVLAQAEFLGRTIPRLVEDGATVEHVRGLVIALLVIGAARAMLAVVTSRSADRALDHVERRLRDRLLDHAEHSVVADGDGLAHRRAVLATLGPQELEPYLRAFLPALMLSAVVPVAAGVRIASLDLISAAIVAVTVPLIPIFMILIGKMTQVRARRSWAVMQRLGGHFADVLNGLPTLRLFGRGGAQASNVQRVADDYRRATASTMRIAMLSALALELLATLSVAIVAVAIGLRMVDGEVGLRVGLTVLLLAPECYLPIRRVGAAFHQSERGIDAVSDHLATTAAPTIPTGSVEPSNASTALTTQQVTIRPEADAPAITIPDTSFEPGHVSVITGPSGSGKTTLIRALRRRVIVDAGAIRHGGTDLSEIDSRSWSDRVVAVEQRPVPLWTTVREEIAGAHGQPETVTAVAHRLGLGSLLDAHSDTLSGGELRRAHLAQAAAAIIDGSADIIIVDEPTAQLDTASAAAVLDELRSLAATHGATVIAATHDPRIIAAADRRCTLGATRTSMGDDADAEVGLPRAGQRRTQIEPATSAPTLHDVASGLRTVAGLLRPSRGRFAGAIALGVLAEGCTIGLAAVSAWLIVRASELPDLAVLAAAVTGVRAFGLGKGVFRYVERLAVHDAALDGLGRVRTALISHLAEVDPLAIDDSHGLAQRTVRDVDELLDLIARAVHPLAVSTIAAIVSTTALLLLDLGAGLTAFGFAMVLVVAAPLAASQHQLRARADRASSDRALFDSTLRFTTNLDAFAGRGEIEQQRMLIDEAADDARRNTRRMRAGRTTVEALVAAGPVLCVAAVLMALAGSGASLTGPTLAVALLAPLAIIELAGGGANVTTHLVDGGTAAANVGRTLALPVERAVATRPSGATEASNHPDLCAETLTARRNDTAPEVGPVSMRLRRGTRRAVTGPSGSGKSTFAAALVGYSPSSYEHLEITGDDVDTLDGSARRERVIWVDQQPWLADSTIAANLRIAAPDATDAELFVALDAVDLGDWVRTQPERLALRVGRAGSRMSGGQAHRLGLARAVLSTHRLVVLDEPTSHLDADTAERVLVGLDSSFGDHRSAVILVHDTVGLDPIELDGHHALAAN